MVPHCDLQRLADWFGQGSVGFLAKPLFNLFDYYFRLAFLSMRHQPSWALRNEAPNINDNESQQSAQSIRKTPSLHSGQQIAAEQ